MSAYNEYNKYKLRKTAGLIEPAYKFVERSLPDLLKYLQGKFPYGLGPFGGVAKFDRATERAGEAVYNGLKRTGKLFGDRFRAISRKLGGTESAEQAARGTEAAEQAARGAAAAANGAQRFNIKKLFSLEDSALARGGVATLKAAPLAAGMYGVYKYGPEILKNGFSPFNEGAGGGKGASWGETQQPSTQAVAQTTPVTTNAAAASSATAQEQAQRLASLQAAAAAAKAQKAKDTYNDAKASLAMRRASDHDYDAAKDPFAPIGAGKGQWIGGPYQHANEVYRSDPDKLDMELDKVRNPKSGRWSDASDIDKRAKDIVRQYPQSLPD